MSTRAADAARWREHLARAPNDAIAWHNLAAAEGDLGRASVATSAAQRAVALGGTAAETRLVLARALQSLGRLDEAAAAFKDAIARKPAYADAHRDYAQLVWMRTGSMEDALERLDAAILAAPSDASLHLVRSIVLEFTGDSEAALEAARVGLARAPDDTDLLLRTAHLEAEGGDAARGLSLAERASALAERDSGPGTVQRRHRAAIARCEVLLALGRIEAVESILAPLIAAMPDNQYLLALRATTLRIRADPGYAALHDYDRLVATRMLSPPAGWSLSAFVADVATELESMHRFVAHPFQQSVRGGGQLTFSEDDMRRPAIGALFQSIAAAVQAHLAALGSGRDPMRARNTGRAAFTGAWSVRLASGGSHVDHVHPHGWLSSACYLSLPETIGTGLESSRGPDRSGWLRLGQPGVRTAPSLAADHYVRPEPGLLALFPAYMWHGVEPFTSRTPRLTVAFDVIPG